MREGGDGERKRTGEWRVAGLFDRERGEQRGRREQGVRGGEKENRGVEGGWLRERGEQRGRREQGVRGGEKENRGVEGGWLREGVRGGEKESKEGGRVAGLERGGSRGEGGSRG